MEYINNRVNKPKQLSSDLIKKMKDEKGIEFNLMSEQEASEYLFYKNNYMRTASYRKNYKKYDGKYVHLDFKYLAELSTIDMYLRNYLLQMTIDIEHACKVMLLRQIELNGNEDGYDIVDEFLKNNQGMIHDFELKSDGIFTEDLMGNYFSLSSVYDDKKGTLKTKILKQDCPAWVFVELLSFGNFLKFLHLYEERNGVELIPEDNIINPVKSLRNACAHNNCLLNDLNRKDDTGPTERISQFVAKTADVPKRTRRNRLQCRPMLEIACMLYVYMELVKPEVKKHRIEELHAFTSGRMIKHLDYFDGPKGNYTVYSSLTLLNKIVDKLYKMV